MKIKNIKKIIFIIFIILLIPIVEAGREWTPIGNISLKDYYWILNPAGFIGNIDNTNYNGTFDYVFTNGTYITDVCLTNGSNCDYFVDNNATMTAYVDFINSTLFTHILTNNNSVITYVDLQNSTMTTYVNSINSSLFTQIINNNNSQNSYWLNNNGTVTTYINAINSTLFNQIITNNNSQNSYWLNNNDTFRTFTDDNYVNITGDTMTGNLLVETNITIDKKLKVGNVLLFNKSFNGLWNGSLHIVSSNSSNGQLLFTVSNFNSTSISYPHFWVQRGGSELASGISRSFMIINEIPKLQNTANISSCRAFFDYSNETMQIDCNTSTTGADLVVGDDVQILGDVWMKNGRNQWRFLSLLLGLDDDLKSNILYTSTNTTLDGTKFNINSTLNETFIINIESNITFTNIKGDTLTINTNTDADPAINYIYYQDKTNPTLTKASANPGSSDINHVDIARIIAGASASNLYLFDNDKQNLIDFITNSYKRAEDSGAIYKSGLSIQSSTLEINISTGKVRVRLEEVEYLNKVQSLVDYFIIENGGVYVECTDFTCLDEYSDGTAISSNKYFTVVWGVAPINYNQSRMIAIIQGKPATEYNSVALAEGDTANAAVFFPSEDRIKPTFVPVARTVHRRQGTQNAQLLSNGLYYLDIRGSVTSSAGTPASPVITDHDQLNNLLWSVAGHTIDTNVDLSTNSLIGGVDINSTNFYQSGNKVLDVTDNTTLVTYITAKILTNNNSQNAYWLNNNGTVTSYIDNINSTIYTHIINNNNSVVTYVNTQNITMTTYVDFINSTLFTHILTNNNSQNAYWLVNNATLVSYIVANNVTQNAYWLNNNNTQNTYWVASNATTTTYINNQNTTMTTYVDSSISSIVVSLNQTLFKSNTSSTYDGGNMDYDTANAICNSAISGSHVCTGEELLQSMIILDTSSLANWTGTAWFQDGAPGFTANANDCQGWNSTSNTDLGRFWDFEDTTPNGKGWLTNCASTKPFACCGVI